MIPAKFDYEVAESAEHAIALLGEHEDAKLLAGGHSLLPAMKLRIARPALLIDIARVDELSYVRDGGDHVAIGAVTRHKDVRDAPLLQEHCPIVSFTAGQVGDPQVRHLGTIGGSICHSDPASDLPAVLFALDAEMVVRSSGGERTIPAIDFCTGVFATALAEGEMLVEIRVPKLGPSTTVVVREDGAPSPGLGDRRRRRRRGAGQRVDLEGGDRAHEHGGDAGPGPPRGGGDREAVRRSTRPRRSSRRTATRRRTTRRPASSASTWPRCSAGVR